MSRGFRIFLFAVLSLAVFWTYQFRKSDLARLFEGFYDQLIRVDTDVTPPWRRALDDYNRRYPLDGLPNPTGNPGDEVVVVEVRERLPRQHLNLEPSPEAVPPEPAVANDASLTETPLHLPTGDADDPGEDDLANSQPSPGGELPVPPPSLPLSPEDTDFPPDSGVPKAHEPRASEDFEVIEHLVTEGDRLWNIAARYLGKGHRYGEILEWNGLTEELLQPGMRLKIRVPAPRHRLRPSPRDEARKDGEPPAEPRVLVHEVSEGESLASLARRYYSGDSDAWERIFRANRDVVADPNVLVVDMKLRIPDPHRRRDR